ncbi:MAG: vanadium-dependent haloperoxidase [bacterium]
MRFSRAIAAGMFLFALGCGAIGRDAAPHSPEAELLHTAMHQLSSVIVYDIFSPPQASRVYAYASIAAYETLRQEHAEHPTLAGQLNGLTPVPAPAAHVKISLPLAGVHAFMTVGRALTFSRPRMDSLRSAMDAHIRAGGVPAAVYDSSIAYGERVAQHILAWAGKDQFVQTRGYPKYTVVSKPGRWVPTPPSYMDGVEPNWAFLRPFVLDSASQLRPPPPPSFDMTPGSPFYTNAKEVYETGKHLTDEQIAIAKFWDCNPYVMHVQGHAMFATKKITPGGHWMGIAAIASRNAKADVMRSSEVYARTAIALADGFISAWDEKYRSMLIRPETVINTNMDEAWEPLLQTPPFPEYPSGHSVVSNAAAVVLAREYGTPFAFVDSSEVEYGLPARSYSSFEAAAAEAAISRLYAGIHFRPAIEFGALQGRAIGALVNERIHTRAVAVRPVADAGAPTTGRSNH